MNFRACLHGGGGPLVGEVTRLSILSLILITSAEREVKDSRRSGMYQSCNFLTRLGKQSL